jgi:hypothetical protein
MNQKHKSIVAQSSYEVLEQIKKRAQDTYNKCMANSNRVIGQDAKLATEISQSEYVTIPRSGLTILKPPSAISQTTHSISHPGFVPSSMTQSQSVPRFSYPGYVPSITHSQSAPSSSYPSSVSSSTPLGQSLLGNNTNMLIDNVNHSVPSLESLKSKFGLLPPPIYPNLNPINNNIYNNNNNAMSNNNNKNSNSVSNYNELLEQIYDTEDFEDLLNEILYRDYVPSKLNIGYPHPDILVESSSLNSVNLPDIKYHLQIPDYVCTNLCVYCYL